MLQTGTATLQALAGTPHFMSPEQIQRAESSRRRRTCGVWVWSCFRLWAAPSSRWRNRPNEDFVCDRERAASAAVGRGRRPTESLTAFRTHTSRAAEASTRPLRVGASNGVGAEEAITLSGGERFDPSSATASPTRSSLRRHTHAHVATKARPREPPAGLLDKVRLVDGQRFDENHQRPSNSMVFSPLRPLTACEVGRAR